MPVAVPPAAVISAILGPSTRITRRFEIYQADAKTLWKTADDTAGRLVSGNVTVAYGTDVRRTLDIEMDNRDDTLNSDPNGGFWYDKIIKVYRGITYGANLSWECQVGEFMIDRLSYDVFPHTVKVTGRDYVKKCQNSKFTNTTTFSSGLTLENVITGIAANAGITKHLIPTTSKVLGKDFPFDRGTTRWDAMTQLTTAFGYELFFDATGYLVMREFEDPTTYPLAFSFETGALGSLVSANRTANDSQLYNHILVTGDNSDTTVPNVAAEAMNTEPSSPTSIDKIGDRLYQYASSFITTVDQAQDTATKFLQIYAQEQFELAIASLVLPWLDVGSIVQILDDPTLPVDSDHPARFLLTALTVPLTMDAMQATGNRLTIVTDDGQSRPQYQINLANRFAIFAGVPGDSGS